MPRLVAFGCSYTFGVGLPDVHPHIYDTPRIPSAMAWPNILAKMLDREVQNLGVGGSGNAEILDKILRYEFLPDDIVVIMWSHFVRHDHFRIKHLNFTGSREWKDLARFQTDPNLIYENAYNNYMSFHHCELFLKNKNIESYSIAGFKADWDMFPIPKFLNLENLLNIDENYFLDRALDKAHFGIKSHAKLAEIIYNKIKK